MASLCHVSNCFWGRIAPKTAVQHPDSCGHWRSKSHLTGACTSSRLKGIVRSNSSLGNEPAGRTDAVAVPNSEDCNVEKRGEADVVGDELGDKLVEELEIMEEEVMREDEGRSAGDYGRRARLFDTTSRVLLTSVKSKNHNQGAEA